jgi:D-glycero-D-manno-heptose 1,7-bisphosphate phosphatase
MGERVFFLDKDGVLVDNSNYPPIIPSDNILEREILDGLKYIQEKGYKLIIISNQPWIAKGKRTQEEIEEIFINLKENFLSFGIKIDDYFYCPHQSSDNCECKKPKTGLIKKVLEKYQVDFTNSFMVGDMDLDILFGKNIGVKTILVLTGNGNDFKNSNPDYIIKNLNCVNKIM